MHYDASIAYFWVATWIVACGVPLAASMALPAWVDTQDHSKSEH